LAGAGRERSELRAEAVGGRLELAGVPDDWPARVRARIYAPVLASAFEGSGLEAQLGSFDLAPPFAQGAPDPRRRRVAPRPAWLERAPPGAALRMELADPEGGGLLGQVALAAPRPAELEARPEDLARLELAAGSAARRAPPQRPAPSRWAPVFLLAGLVALSLAALGDPFAARRRAGSSAPAVRSKSD
jgi:hypothetical protein